MNEIIEKVFFISWHESSIGRNFISAAFYMLYWKKAALDKSGNTQQESKVLSPLVFEIWIDGTSRVGEKFVKKCNQVNKITQWDLNRLIRVTEFSIDSYRYVYILLTISSFLDVDFSGTNGFQTAHWVSVGVSQQPLYEGSNKSSRSWPEGVSVDSFRCFFPIVLWPSFFCGSGSLWEGGNEIWVNLIGVKSLLDL